MIYSGHVIRKGSVKRLAITVRLDSRRGRGWPRDTYIWSLKRWVDPTARDIDIITATADREMWRSGHIISLFSKNRKFSLKRP